VDQLELAEVPEQVVHLDHQVVRVQAEPLGLLVHQEQAELRVLVVLEDLQEQVVLLDQAGHLVLEVHQDLQELVVLLDQVEHLEVAVLLVFKENLLAYDIILMHQV
jgi:hypothetical protein